MALRQEGYGERLAVGLEGRTGLEGRDGAREAYGDPDKGAQPPQYQDFFLNVQRAFGPKMTLSVAYSGSVARHLPGAGVAGPFTDQIPLKYLPLGSLLTQTLSSSTIASAAALGFTVAAPFPNFTGTIGQALKPYPKVSSLQLSSTPH